MIKNKKILNQLAFLAIFSGLGYNTVLYGPVKASPKGRIQIASDEVHAKLKVDVDKMRQEQIAEGPVAKMKAAAEAARQKKLASDIEDLESDERMGRLTTEHDELIARSLLDQQLGLERDLISGRIGIQAERDKQLKQKQTRLNRRVTEQQAKEAAKKDSEQEREKKRRALEAQRRTATQMYRAKALKRTEQRSTEAVAEKEARKTLELEESQQQAAEELARMQEEAKAKIAAQNAEFDASRQKAAEQKEARTTAAGQAAVERLSLATPAQVPATQKPFSRREIKRQQATLATIAKDGRGFIEMDQARIATNLEQASRNEAKAKEKAREWAVLTQKWINANIPNPEQYRWLYNRDELDGLIIQRFSGQLEFTKDFMAAVNALNAQIGATKPSLWQRMLGFGPQTTLAKELGEVKNILARLDRLLGTKASNPRIIYKTNVNAQLSIKIFGEQLKELEESKTRTIFAILKAWFFGKKTKPEAQPQPTGPDAV